MIQKVYFIYDTRGYSIGDRIGLFPIAYADRVQYSSQRDRFSEEEDLYIISETVEKVMLQMITFTAQNLLYTSYEQSENFFWGDFRFQVTIRQKCYRWRLFCKSFKKIRIRIVKQCRGQIASVFSVSTPGI